MYSKGREMCLRRENVILIPTLPFAAEDITLSEVISDVRTAVSEYAVLLWSELDRIAVGGIVSTIFGARSTFESYEEYSTELQVMVGDHMSEGGYLFLPDMNNCAGEEEEYVDEFACMGEYEDEYVCEDEEYA